PPSTRLHHWQDPERSLLRRQHRLRAFASQELSSAREILPRAFSALPQNCPRQPEQPCIPGSQLCWSRARRRSECSSLVRAALSTWVHRDSVTVGIPHHRQPPGQRPATQRELHWRRAFPCSVFHRDRSVSD